MILFTLLPLDYGLLERELDVKTRSDVDQDDLNDMDQEHTRH